MFLIKYPVQEIVCRPEPASWLSTTRSFHPSVFIKIGERNVLYAITLMRLYSPRHLKRQPSAGRHD